MFRHIKNRILFSYLTVLLSCFLAVLIITSLFLWKTYFSYALDDLKDDAGLFIDDFTKQAIINQDLNLLKKILDKAEDNYTIDIFGLKNGVGGNSKRQAFIKKQNFQQEEFKIIPSRGYGYTIREENNIKTVYLAVPIIEQGKRIGFVRISTPLLYIEKTISWLRFYVLLIFLFAAAISLPVGIFLSKGISSPLLEVTRVAKEVSSGNLTKRVAIKSRADEIGILANTFNEMIKKLEQSHEDRKVLLDNISHELVTPITIIRGFIETLDEGRIKDKQSISECLEVIKNESGHLEELIEELRFVSQIDALSVKYDFKPLDIIGVILEVERPLSLKAKEKAVTITNDFLKECPLIKADYKTLKQVFFNLLDNAIKYSFLGKSVLVSVRRKDKFIEVTVKDEGAGVSLEDRANIFKRFYRGRNEQYQAKGLGLGLSIVKEILNAHKVPIRFESQVNPVRNGISNGVNKGTKFIVSFPII